MDTATASCPTQVLRQHIKLLPEQHNIKETGLQLQRTEQYSEVQTALLMAVNAPRRLPLVILTCACILQLVLAGPRTAQAKMLPAVAHHAEQVPLQPLPSPADLQVLPQDP